MNSAKSTRRVMLLSRIGSPTCRLHTGRPWLSPSSRSLPRTTVHRVSLANTRRHASTWSSRSAKRARRASGPKTFTIALSFHEYTSWPSRVMCHPHENTRRAPGGAWSSTAWAVPVEYPWTPRGTSTTSTPSHPATARLMTSGSSVAPGMTVMRPLNLSSFPTLCSPAHADDLVAAIERVLHHVLAELSGGSDDADPHRPSPCASVVCSPEGMAIAPARSFSPASTRNGGYSVVISAA